MFTLFCVLTQKYIIINICWIISKKKFVWWQINTSVFVNAHWAISFHRYSLYNTMNILEIVYSYFLQLSLDLVNWLINPIVWNMFERFFFFVFMTVSINLKNIICSQFQFFGVLCSVIFVIFFGFWYYISCVSSPQPLQNYISNWCLHYVTQNETIQNSLSAIVRKLCAKTLHNLEVHSVWTKWKKNWPTSLLIAHHSI